MEYDIKKRREELGLTLEQIGKYVGVGKSTVKKWEDGSIENMKRDKIAKLSDILQVSPIEIMGLKPNAPTITEDFTTFPVIGEVAAGYDHIAIEDWEGDIIDIPNSYLKGHGKDDFFVLRVMGDSMYPTYHENDHLLILKRSTVDSGSVAVVVYDDEISTLKRVEYKKGEDWLKLVPINPNYPPIKIEDERLEHCKVIGIPKLLVRIISE